MQKNVTVKQITLSLKRLEKNALADVFGVGKESQELKDIMETMREKDQQKIASRYYREKHFNYKKTAKQIFSSSTTFFKNVKMKKKVQEEIELPTLSALVRKTAV